MKELKEFPGYFVTEDGKVYSCKKVKGIGGTTGGSISYNDYVNIREKSSYRDKDGYYRVKVHKNGKGYIKAVHRLVAETYINNPNNLPQVNHIDEDKTNNHISNLEWVTHKQNSVHSCCRYEYLIENVISGDLLKVVNYNEFCCENNLDRRNLHKTLTGRQNHHKNFKIVSKTKFK